MTNVIDEYEILEEIATSLRNTNILTTTERNVTTEEITGTINSTTLHPTRTDIKNIRYILVNSTTLTPYTDYTIDYDSDSGNVNQITFTTLQNGDYNVGYDYGVDHIHVDYAKNHLSIESFPRIGMGVIDIATEPGGWGNVNKNRVDISIIAYAPSKKKVRTMIKNIRTWMIDNQNRLYNLKLIKPVLQGPIGPGDFPKVKDKIFQQNIDLRSTLNYEKN